MANKPMTAEEREALESFYCDRRIIELVLCPVHGNFDSAHLKEIHRRIFQDLPAAGFDDVKPGEFRPSVPEGKEWMKNRVLSTVQGSFYVAYSRMDNAAQARLHTALEDARPDKLRALKTAEFTTKIANLYATLDHAHPFSDGNSRTLRTFTQQLANEVGYEIDWERFNRNNEARDLLYIARDRSVNKLAKPYIEHEQSMRKIINSMSRLTGYRDLANLLSDVVRPSRAVAFERLSESDALQMHPDLEAAYEILHQASVYFESKMPGKPESQQQALKDVFHKIQDCLNKG